MRTAAAVVALTISVAQSALGEFEESGPSGLSHVETAGTPSGGVYSSARADVVGLPLDPKIAHEISRVRAHAPQLESSPVGLPILVKSERESGSIRGEVYSIVSQTFEAVRDELGNPSCYPPTNRMVDEGHDGEISEDSSPGPRRYDFIAMAFETRGVCG